MMVARKRKEVSCKRKEGKVKQGEGRRRTVARKVDA